MRGEREREASSSTLSTMGREATHPFPRRLVVARTYVPEKEQRNNIKVTRNVLYVVGLDDMKDYGGIHE